MDLEGAIPNHIKRESWRTVLTLAYQSLGVVYGDLGTSPLYVYRSTFAEDIHHSESNDEIYGVLSFVFWTLTLVPLFKYVFIVLRADDNGEGGTFALYSLLCRHARVSSLPNCQVADEELSEYKKDEFVSDQKKVKSRLKSTLEKHKLLHKVLLILALIGACMVIGDGVLSPAISVFSAVSGLELSTSKEHHQYKEPRLNMKKTNYREINRGKETPLTSSQSNLRTGPGGSSRTVNPIGKPKAREASASATRLASRKV